uniref:Putative zinc finger, CCHC-type n=1 Tax=Tanacetum cinerariifolium TaxID=118510 RepID=A0A6L2NTC8_TANCI|nr:putative zinc finger, CCHC-type [Tanacetum cinerariifolium]GEY97955.1 putative zinc finger, CCHC-type [Tanacetum cinerariifolium]
MFQAKASKERLHVVKSLMACKLKPRASICAFVLEMKGYFDRLESLNMVFDTELSINIILSGVSADYNQFVLSYRMNGKNTLIMELHSLLQIVEQGIKKINVPSTSSVPVLTVGHNTKKIKTSHFNWKGNATQGKSDRSLSNEVDKSKLWNSCLGHVNKKRIAQLQKDGVLESFDFKSNDNPSEGHWTAVNNILKYLRNTKDMFLVYSGEEGLRVTGYCDTSWQTDKDDSRS